MKFYYIFGILALSAFGGIVADLMEDFKSVWSQCMEEDVAPLGEMIDYIGADMDPAKLTDNIKCFHKCLLDKPGLMKEGKLDDAAIMESLDNYPELKDDADDFANAVDLCKDVEGADDCDTAYEIVMCLRSFKPGH